MRTVAMEQQKKIHPHKFTLWIGIGGILMMFAGLTSAYIVKRNQANWVSFELPTAFWYSTVAIAVSSITLFLASRSYKKREIPKYRRLMTATIILGVLFMTLQLIGFNQLIQREITLTGNVSFSFLYVIVGIHAVHVLGGLIALLILFIKAFRSNIRTYNSTPLEVVSTYWHFVDILWVYLLIFLMMIR
jgi:cytochrome c oxidase subunit 3